MSWIKTMKENEESVFTHFGNVTRDEKSILIYGPNTEGMREKQSKRKINIDLLVKMLRGCCKIGTVGTDALIPLENRKHIEIESFANQQCPYRDEYIKACEIVAHELQQLDIEIPNFICTYV